MNAIVLFGDVVDSRRDSPAATAWLRTLADELAGAYPPAARLADFEFTQGDELQGLLVPGADPLVAVVRAWLHPDGLPMRWIAVIFAPPSSRALMKRPTVRKQSRHSPRRVNPSRLWPART